MNIKHCTERIIPKEYITSFYLEHRYLQHTRFRITSFEQPLQRLIATSDPEQIHGTMNSVNRTQFQNVTPECEKYRANSKVARVNYATEGMGLGWMRETDFSEKQEGCDES
jgi:hypothetical protein